MIRQFVSESVDISKKLVVKRNMEIFSIFMNYEQWAETHELTDHRYWSSVPPTWASLVG